MVAAGIWGGFVSPREMEPTVVFPEFGSSSSLPAQHSASKTVEPQSCLKDGKKA